jgi:hypothetical protein
MSQVISIDLDGVIHAHVSAWTDAHEILDGPVPGAFDFIRSAIDAGFDVFIFTSRAKTVTTVPHIYAWLRKHGLEERYCWKIEITAIKHSALVYIDDNGWRFDGTFPSLDVLRSLKRWDKNGAPVTAGEPDAGADPKALVNVSEPTKWGVWNVTYGEWSYPMPTERREPDPNSLYSEPRAVFSTREEAERGVVRRTVTIGYLRFRYEARPIKSRFCTCGVVVGPDYEPDPRQAWRHQSFCPHAQSQKGTGKRTPLADDGTGAGNRTG